MSVIALYTSGPRTLLEVSLSGQTCVDCIYLYTTCVQGALSTQVFSDGHVVSLNYYQRGACSQRVI